MLSDNLRVELGSLLHSKHLTSAEFVAHYVFAHLRARQGTRWYGSRRVGRQHLTRIERERLNALEVVQAYQLNGVSGDAHAGLLGWLEGRYPLKLRFDIPSPTEMLDRQCEGERYVTLMPRPEQQFQPYGRHAGALEFLLHDLEHAHKFFANKDWTRGQIRFFRQVRATFFPDFDARFAAELDYVRADMNSHPLHLLKYLKAILLGAFERQNRHHEYEFFCHRLFEGWGLPLTEALRLNHPAQERPSDGDTLSDFYLSL